VLPNVHHVYTTKIGTSFYNRHSTHQGVKRLDTQGKEPSRWRVVLRIFLSDVMGSVVFFMIGMMGLALVARHIQPNTSDIVRYEILFLAFAFAFVCALVAASYAKSRVSRLDGTNGYLAYAHATPLVVDWLILWFVVQRCVEILSFGYNGSLPWETQFCADLAGWTRRYWFIALPILVGFLFGDARVYLWLYRCGYRRCADIWLKSIAYSLLALIPFMWWACCLPIFGVGAGLFGR
jgi:hypothetical protein